MRRLLPLVLLVTAGCLAPAAPGTVTGTDVLPLPDAPFQRVVSVVNGEIGMGEPSLGVTADGALFTTGRVPGSPRDLTAYRSTDGGATWEATGTPLRPFPNFDPDLAVDADGTVWLDLLYLACNAVAVSRDQGETWASHPAVCNGPVGDRQYVIPTQGGEAYLYYHQIPTFWQTGMKTTDYGRTWFPTGPMEPVSPPFVDGNSGWGGGGFWNPTTGSVFATFTFFGASEAFPAFSVTRDGGASWELTRVADPWGEPLGLGLVVGAADEAGNVYVSWAESKDDDVAVFLAVSRDDGMTFGAPIRVDDGSGSKVFPAITAGPEGKVAIAYYEADVDGHPNEVPDDATWTVTLAWTEDALADAPAFERETLSAGPAKKGAICPNGSGCQGDRQLLDYFAVKRLPDGRVAAVWTSTEDVKEKTVNLFAATERAILS